MRAYGRCHDDDRSPTSARRRASPARSCARRRRLRRARKIHNGLIDKRPALIARCRSTADVVDAVNAARDADLEISVRGGGHNVAGKAVTEGGLMIDLSLDEGHPRRPGAANGARPGRRHRARARPRDRRLRARHARAASSRAPASPASRSAAASRWLMGRYGMAIDNLLSAEVVLASGDVVTASDDADR